MNNPLSDKFISRADFEHLPERYWKERFFTEPPLLDAFLEYRRPKIPSYSRIQISRPFSRQTSELLHGISECTPAGVVAAAWFSLLSRVTEEFDICVGLVPQNSLRTIYPLRASMRGLSGLELASFLSKILNGEQELPSISWSWFQAHVWFQRSSVRAYPFQTAFFPGISACPALQSLTPLRNMDLVLVFEESNEGPILHCEYDPGLFSQEYLRTRLQQLEILVQEIAKAPQNPLTDICFFGSDDYDFLKLCNNTHTIFPNDTTIHELFRKQAQLTPDQICLLEPGSSITYGEIDYQSSCLARLILETIASSATAPPPTTPVVGIHVEQSALGVISILAALKAGACYLPLDPSFPEERLRYMLDDAHASLLLTSTPPSQLSEWQKSISCLSLNKALLASLQTPIERQEISPDSAFCLMYTSGSTGQPKGVINTHRATLNCFHWMWLEFPFQPGEICCITSPLAFGDSIQEIFGPLLQGIPLLLLSTSLLRNPRGLVDLLRSRRVTRITLVPSLLERLVDAYGSLVSVLPFLRLWITSGEALTRDLAKHFLRSHPQARLINLYGASELSNDVTFHEVRRLSLELYNRVPIGRPIHNMQIAVADKDRRLCPVGVPGELWVAGQGLTPGYLNRPELNNSRFFTRPFAAQIQDSEFFSRGYRTGDWVRLRVTGELEYLGRVDSQVKIAGKRIELEEIEGAIRNIPGVRSAVAALRQSPRGIPQIIAYVVWDSVSPLSRAEVETHLRRILPDYMIPSMWQYLPKLPMTETGKIDRRNLPDPTWGSGSFRASPHSAKALTVFEKKVLEVWRQVIDIPAEDGSQLNFFEVGGTSLALMLLLVKLEDTFQVSLQSQDLFCHPTLEKMANRIHNSLRESGSVEFT